MGIDPLSDAAAAGPGSPSMSGGMTGRLCGKVLVCITEDWFLLSHFKPLIGKLRQTRETIACQEETGRSPTRRAKRLRRGWFGEVDVLKISMRCLQFSESSPKA